MPAAIFDPESTGLTDPRIVEAAWLLVPDPNGDGLRESTRAWRSRHFHKITSAGFSGRRVFILHILTHVEYSQGRLDTLSTTIEIKDSAYTKLLAKSFHGPNTRG